MSKREFLIIVFSSICLVSTCGHTKSFTKTKTVPLTSDTLTQPFQTKSTTNYSKVIVWHVEKVPVAPVGFTVTKFADAMEHPCWIYVGDNGDVFVAESNTILKDFLKLGASPSRKVKTQHYGKSANRITMFRDANKDGVAEYY